MARHLQVSNTGPSLHVKMAEISRQMPFCYRFRLGDRVLEDSIRRQGVLIPLTVQKLGNRYRVLAGHKRLEIARKLGCKKIPVYEIEKKLSAKDGLIFSLISNWRQDVSEMDRARALTKALQEFGFKADEVRNVVMPLLGLPEEQGVLGLYLKADAMALSVKDLFDEKKLPFRGVSALLRFSTKDQDCFARCLGSKMRLTASQFVQVADWLADIVKRDNKSLALVLKQNLLRKILNHPKMDPRTKADQFFAAIKKLRFPDYEAYLERFEKIRPLILREGKDIRFNPVAGFEDKGIDLHARVRTPADLERVLQKLSDSRSALNSLFDFML